MRKIILFLSILFLSISFNVKAQQDWYWKSPNPQGNQITQIFTGNDILFGLGECSTIISTSNSGNSWNVLNRVTGAQDNLTAFQKFDENTYYLGTSYNMMQRSTDGGNSWFGTALIYEGPTATGIRGIAYTSSSIGYAATYKKIFKTINGGITWSLLITLSDEITSINFTDNNTGFATTMGFMEGGVSTVYKTTNGGNNWVPTVFGGWAETFRILKFINENTGFILYGGSRNGNRLHKTINGGLNWTRVGVSEVFGRLHIFDENNFTGTDYYNFKITTNAGITWILKTQPFLETRDMYFQSSQKGYLLDYNNRISFTENGGNNWTQITEANGNGSANDIIKNIEFVNENTGFICSNNNYFKKTTNAGETWLKYETGLISSISDLDFLDANTGFISGNNTWQIYFGKTTNGGENFTTSFVYDAYDGTKVKFLNSNTGFIAARYKFFRTSNSGANWQLMSFPDSIDIYSMEFIDANTGMFCCGLYQSFVTKIYRTTNSGVNWNPIYSTPSAQYNQLGKIKMVNSLKGYIAGYGIWTTSNGGANWIKLYIEGIPQNTYISAIDFIDEQTGYAGASGVLYKTTDGGTHWATGSVPTQKRFEGIKFFNSSTGIIVGGNGAILKTTNGGGVFIVGVIPVNNIIVNNYKLHQNYPNPFNPVTNIQFDIPKSDFVKVKVYDILGKEVENLLNEFKSAGSYLISFDASRLGSGIYFYKLTAGNFSETKKMILVK
jgi:photosystem II stability/assembly factor-like uncharacterized protein